MWKRYAAQEKHFELKGGIDSMLRRTPAISVLLALLIAASLSATAGAVKLLIWDYVPWRVEYYQQYADEYMQLNPGVEVEVQLVPQGEYVSRIVVGAVTGTAPAAFAGHPTWIGSFAGMLEPFPHDLFPPDEMTAELLGYEQLLQDGDAYYYPLGMQGPMLFINQDLWDQAGLADPPRTWEEAVSIGRRATQAPDGATRVAGFYFTDDMTNDVFVDLNYQLGGTIYKNGGAQVAFDEVPAMDAINMLSDWYSTGISGNGGLTMDFRASQVVMRYGYAWRQQQWDPVPDLRWTVAALPTMTGEFHPGMSRMDYYFGLAVPSGNSPEVTRAAFEFISWAYNDDSKLMDLNSRSGTLPARMSLWNEPEIVENQVLRQLTQTLPYATSPGDYPEWIKNSLGQVRNAITSGSADPVILLQDVTRQINARLAEEPITWVAE